jgi:hypothetical protein
MSDAIFILMAAAVGWYLRGRYERIPKRRRP